jgi:hypothetical protein
MGIEGLGRAWGEELELQGRSSMSSKLQGSSKELQELQELEAPGARGGAPLRGVALRLQAERVA